MNAPLMSQDEFHNAAALCLDGVIDEATHARFESALRSDCMFRQLYCELAQTHAALAWTTRWQVSVTDQAPRPLPRDGGSARWIAIAAMVALAAGIGWLYWQRPMERSPVVVLHADGPGLAIVTDKQGAVFADAADSLALGSAVMSEPIRLVRGAAQLMLTSTAVIDLNGPCEVQITGRNEAKLVRGRLEAFVPKEAHGFTVTLPDGGRVIDLGTRFVASADAMGKSTVFVIEGAVKAVRGDRNALVHVGQVAHFEHDSVRIAPMSAQALSPLLGKTIAINNGDFENGLEGSESLASGWSNLPQARRDRGFAYSGDYAMRFTNEGGFKYRTIVQNLGKYPAGTRLSIVAMARHEPEAPLTGGQVAQMNVAFFDAEHHEKRILEPIVTAEMPAGVYRAAVLRATVPTGTTEIQLAIGIASVDEKRAAVVHVDQVMVFAEPPEMSNARTPSFGKP
ncbi:MAG: hypothetical protein GC162_13360 [Planctomycetes bacterium]|nr:hypothetical protein [Planctomycetota bacterium]